MELNSGNLRSQCEAVTAVLQGLMSSKGGTSAGCVMRGVTGSELADICQQSHMSVMGRNSMSDCLNHILHKHACAMLLAADLPKFLWAKSVQHVMWLKNHMLMCALN